MRTIIVAALLLLNSFLSPVVLAQKSVGAMPGVPANWQAMQQRMERMTELSRLLEENNEQCSQKMQEEGRELQKKRDEFLALDVNNTSPQKRNALLEEVNALEKTYQGKVALLLGELQEKNKAINEEIQSLTKDMDGQNLYTGSVGQQGQAASGGGMRSTDAAPNDRHAGPREGHQGRRDAAGGTTPLKPSIRSTFPSADRELAYSEEPWFYASSSPNNAECAFSAAEVASWPVNEYAQAHRNQIKQDPSYAALASLASYMSTHSQGPQLGKPLTDPHLKQVLGMREFVNYPVEVTVLWACHERSWSNSYPVQISWDSTYRCAASQVGTLSIQRFDARSPDDRAVSYILKGNDWFGVPWETIPDCPSPHFVDLGFTVPAGYVFAGDYTKGWVEFTATMDQLQSGEVEECGAYLSVPVPKIKHDEHTVSVVNHHHAGHDFDFDWDESSEEATHVFFKDFFESLLKQGVFFGRHVQARSGYSGSAQDCNEICFQVRMLAVPTNRPGALVVSPATEFTSSGLRKKGKFKPPSKIYTLSNQGEETIDFAISKHAEWLGLSLSGGSLAPKQSMPVTVSVTDAAKGLELGTYKDAITFVNTTSGKGNTSRDAVLKVKEEQTWQVNLSGTENAIPGKRLALLNVDEGTYDYVRVNMGAVFVYKLRGVFVIEREEKNGPWKYKEGHITEAAVKSSPVFHQTVFSVKKWDSRDGVIASMKGGQLAGKVSDNKVWLGWPVEPLPRITVTSKMKLRTFRTDGPSSEPGYGEIEFSSDLFLDRAGDQPLPLKDGEFGPVTVPMDGAGYIKNDKEWARSRRDRLWYDYFLKQLD